MGKIKKLNEERAKLKADTKKVLDACKSEKRSMTDEETVAFEKVEARVGEINAELATLETEERARQFAAEGEEKTEESRGNGGNTTDDEECRAFNQYLRDGIVPEEMRADLKGVQAGVTVPKFLSEKVILAMFDNGEMLKNVHIVKTATGAKMGFPIFNGTEQIAAPMAQYKGSSEKSFTLTDKELDAYTYRTPLFAISNELLEDSAVDLEAILIQLMTESLGRGLNKDCTTQTAAGYPKGILADAPVGCTIETTELSYDTIVDIIASVKQPYSRLGVAKFMFNSNTLAGVRKIKDTTGRPIFVESALLGQPGSLLGYPVVINEDMPNMADGATPIIFGDLKKYYLRIVKDIVIKRSADLYMANNAVAYIAFLRADGRLMDAGTHPVKKLQITLPVGA